MAQSARTAQWLAGRTSLVERATSLSPPARRTPTTSTTPTGREGNVAPPVNQVYSWGNLPPNQTATRPGNDSTALWGNNDLRQFDSSFTPGQLFGPSRPLVPQERENVRLRDYPVAYNLSTRPRSLEPVGFAESRALAREVVLVRLAVETSRGADGAEPCCPPPLSGKSSSSTSTSAGCHTWCKRMGFVRGRRRQINRARHQRKAQETSPTRPRHFKSP